MKVRAATEKDIPRLAELGAEFVAATILQELSGYDPASLAGLCLSFIERPETSVVFVLEDEDGEVVGGIAGTLVPLYFNFAKMTAQQLFWFVTPSARGPQAVKLLAAFETWAKEHGAALIVTGAKNDAGLPGMTKLLHRRRFVPLETAFIKEVR